MASRQYILEDNGLLASKLALDVYLNGHWGVQVALGAAFKREGRLLFALPLLLETTMQWDLSLRSFSYQRHHQLSSCLTDALISARLPCFNSISLGKRLLAH